MHSSQSAVSGDCFAAVACRPITPGSRAGLAALDRLLGPGVVLAGTIDRFGRVAFRTGRQRAVWGTLLWLASVSIILQVFCNLMMMRVHTYCGEPIIVGGLRTKPGPRFWIPGMPF